jgi:hypothetical protein
MELNGKWVMLKEDESYEAGHNQVLEIDGTEVRSNRGAIGTVAISAGEIRIDLSPTERLVLAAPAATTDDLSGLAYASYQPLPPGDPVETHEDDADAQSDWWCDSVFLIRDAAAVERFKHGPSRYSTIDVSMYDFSAMQDAGFLSTETDEDVAAALLKLPLAKVFLRSRPGKADPSC